MWSIQDRVFWALLALAQFIAGWLARVFTFAFSLVWPLVLAGLFISASSPAEAGWGSWLWGSDTAELRRSLEVAQEAARVTSEVSTAQANHAAEQAAQNARLAETLGELARERTSLADHLHQLAEVSLQDSKVAAVLAASGPVLVCVVVLTLAGVALWVTNRPDTHHEAAFAETVELLAEEIATGSHEQQGVFSPEESVLRLDRRHSPALVGYSPRRPTEEDAGDHEDEEPMPF